MQSSPAAVQYVHLAAFMIQGSIHPNLSRAPDIELFKVPSGNLGKFPSTLRRQFCEYGSRLRLKEFGDLLPAPPARATGANKKNSVLRPRV